MVKPVKRRDVNRALRRNGCVIKNDKGRHTTWVCQCRWPAHRRHSSPLRDLSGGCRRHHRAVEVLTGGVASVKTYHVRAKRWEHGWELHIEGVGVTQSRTLWDAEDMARDLISRREDLPGDAFAVTVTPEIGGGLDEESLAAREAVSAADRAQRQAA